MNRPDQLRLHLVRARQNGVTQEELIETITHLAFYSGWPNAVSADAVATPDNAPLDNTPLPGTSGRIIIIWSTLCVISDQVAGAPGL